MLFSTCIWGGRGRVPMSTGSPALLTSISLLKLRACLRYSLAVSVCPCCFACSAAACQYTRNVNTFPNFKFLP